MLSKGWHQSELARQSGLNRDAVSTYVRGRTLPTPASLDALARALGVSSVELLPNHVESAMDEDTPALEIKVSTNAPNFAWLRVNRLVSMTTAVKIAELLQVDDASNRIGSSSEAAVQPIESEAPADERPTDLLRRQAGSRRGERP
jgi:transcriptional regulator with XRE-family HTH domain